MKSRPKEYRLVAFTCSESYQVVPKGAQMAESPELNCGYGRNDWATVEEVGKPGYGGLLNPRATAVEEDRVEVSSARSTALLMLRPYLLRISGVSAL